MLITGIAWLGRLLFDVHISNEGALFFLALISIVAAALAATWLRKTAKEWERADG